MKGALFNNTARMNRCRHFSHVRGNGVRVMAVITRRAVAPAASRVKATSTGDIARNPSLIHQNEHPQRAPSKTNDTCHATTRRPVLRVVNGSHAGVAERPPLRGAPPSSPVPIGIQPTSHRIARPDGTE